MKNNYYFGYKRPDGSVGIRNYVLLIPVQGQLRVLSQKICEFVTDVKTPNFPEEIGKSMKDRDMIEKMSISFGLNPNVSSVLILGMEGPTIYEKNFPKETKVERIRKKIAESGKPVKTLVFKENIDYFDAMNKSVKLLRKMVWEASRERREKCGLETISIGLECGASDFTSGISGNPVVGKAADLIVAAGGKAFFSETTEIIGAENVLIKRAKNKEVANKILNAAQEFENKALLTGENITNTNPYQGNIAGGISTLEEKSLGAIAKSGSSIIEDVLEYSEIPKKGGLYFINGPSTSKYLGPTFAAAGAQMMIFQIGKYSLNTTPFGSKGTIIPIFHATGNSETYKQNENYMDFNSGEVFNKIELMEEYSKILLKIILGICSGDKTKVETVNYQEIVELYLKDPSF